MIGFWFQSIESEDKQLTKVINDETFILKSLKIVLHRVKIDDFIHSREKIVTNPIIKNQANRAREQPSRKVKRLNKVPEEVNEEKKPKQKKKNFTLKEKVHNESPHFEFIPNEQVLVTIPGYPPWPDRIESVYGATIIVEFFSNGQKCVSFFVLSMTHSFWSLVEIQYAPLLWVALNLVRSDNFYNAKVIGNRW